MFYSTFESEILRTARTTSSKLFFNYSQMLITRMCEQGERIRTVSHMLTKVPGGYFETF